jgi:carbon storage regulator
VLVLTRRVGESIVVGHDIVITVLEVRGDVVRVGIDAPRDVPVHRQEVYDELSASNREAASPADRDVAALSREMPRRGTPREDD